MLAFTALPSTADAQGRVRGIVRLGGDHGGDEVLQFEYSDGSTPEVTAGGGLLFSAGIAYDALRSTAGHGLDAQAAIGVKYRTIPPATNQEASWLRFPLEGMLFYRAPRNFRLGAGGTVHLRNVFETSGDAAAGRVEFRSSPGAIVQAEYVRGNVAFDLRYTALKYEVTGGASETLDASSIGGGISLFFGRAAR